MNSPNDTFFIHCLFMEMNRGVAKGLRRYALNGNLMKSRKARSRKEALAGKCNSEIKLRESRAPPE